ncbi:hypothetical protein CTAYLR_003379 [Chrysophaeum taylorii]|uniref:Vacuolar membrane-associated protein Iml1 N-terminal domain-containing protein n=1 Tax=Chrysophaeum taylorii TaxID=2483200 RepID=A0AAD7XL78_9STRA|nr:hypothetical protein CTAYLR_003379 [Chrysophaeum taylorii]
MAACSKVHLHDESFRSEELLLSPEWFPEVKDGDVVSLEFAREDAAAPAPAGGENRPLVLRAKLFDGTMLWSKRMQVSLLKRVAEARGVAPWVDATVRLVPDPEKRFAAEFVEFSFKDQFISRADIWRFKSDVVGEAVYVGKTFSIDGMRATARELRGGTGELVESGLLVEKTRFIFRSRSTRIFWLVQMSYEMWEPVSGEDEALHVERLVDGFAAPLLKRWRELDVNHSLSVVLFARLEKEGDDGKLAYDDLYRVALENEHAARIDEIALVAALKRELLSFARSLATRRSTAARREGGYGLAVARAAEGNVLEAINLALNVLDKHYMDRDLQRTGNSIVLLSAGAGVFIVDGKLAQITKQRMMDNGIGMDMVSLSVPPLHTAPIFMVRPHALRRVQIRYDYEVPHWINLSFVDPARAAEPRAWIAAAAPRRARDGWRMGHLDLNAPRSLQGWRRRLLEDDESCGVVDKLSVGAVAKAYGARARIPGVLASLVDSYAAARPRDDEDDDDDGGSSLFRDPLSQTIELARRTQPHHGGDGVSRPLVEDLANSLSVSVSSSGGVWQPSIHIGSLTSRDAREDPIHWYDIGGFASDGSRHRQPSPDPHHHHHHHHQGAGARPRASSPVAEGDDEEEDLEANLPYDYHASLTVSSPDFRFGPSFGAAAIKAAAAGYQQQQQQQQRASRRDEEADGKVGLASATTTTTTTTTTTKNLARDTVVADMAAAAATTTTTTEPVWFRKEKRRPPCRAAGLPLEEQFDAHDEAVYENEAAAAAGEPLARRATFVGAAASGVRTDAPAPSTTTTTTKALTTRPKEPPSSTGHLREFFTNQAVPRGQPPKRGHSGVHDAVLRQTGAAKKKEEQPAGDSAPNYRRFINPFRREDEEEVLRQRSHNRRRWSHVFPQGEEEFRSTHGSVAGPNWKSLTTPAILPLETDYLPDDFGTSAFKESNHGVLMEDTDSWLMNEMVAQRIGGDYQIFNFVEEESQQRRGAGGRHYPSPGKQALLAMARRARAKGNKLLYALSMGHRIQTFTYNALQKGVEVRLFRSQNDNSNVQNYYAYAYSLWVSNDDGASSSSNIRGTYVAKAQTFVKYPSPETNWNLLDEVIRGFLPPAKSLDHVKFRRVLFAVVPEQREDFLVRFRKFEEFLNSKRPKKHRARLDATSTSSTTSTTVDGKQHLEISLDKSSSRWRDQWLALECDAVVDATRCYRFAIHWLLCSGWVVEEFLGLLCRKAKQIGLKLVQVPEYSLRLDIHPFIAHSLAVRLEAPRLREIFESALARKLGCVLDSVAACDMDARRGRGAPPHHADRLATDVVAADKQPHLGGGAGGDSPKLSVLRQYLHRSGCAFLRVHSDGVVTWIRNRLRNPYASFKIRPHDGYDQDVLRNIRAYVRTLRLVDGLFSRVFYPILTAARPETTSIVELVTDFLHESSSSSPVVVEKGGGGDNSVRTPSSLSAASTQATPPLRRSSSKGFDFFPGGGGGGGGPSRTMSPSPGSDDPPGAAAAAGVIVSEDERGSPASSSSHHR